MDLMVLIIPVRMCVPTRTTDLHDTFCGVQWLQSHCRDPKKIGTTYVMSMHRDGTY